MILNNNNFSVLPFYTNTDERNSEKWYVYGRKYPLYMMQNECLPFQIIDTSATVESGSLFTAMIYTPNGTLVRVIPHTQLQNYFAVKGFEEYAIIVCTGGDWLVHPAAGQTIGIPNGTYYMVIVDGQSSMRWYSDYFVYVNDVEPYLCIEWYDDSDLLMDAGAIVYTNPSFRNKLYLPSTIAKPNYNFEEEGETRDGYFFPIKQISSKQYRFTFLAPEYLLDVIRFVRLSEHINITYHGATYPVDNILFTPEWESQGDLAAVTCEFDTATVVKKIGVGYVR